MLEFEVAAIYHFIHGILGVKPYFDEVPSDLEIPCVFYPTPEFEPKSFSTSTYSTIFTMYLKVMDIDSVSAAWKSSQIVQGVSKNRNKIPLVDDNGKLTGKNFRIEHIRADKVENGVYQIGISWKRYTSYTEKTAELAREFFFNGLPVGN